MKQMWSTLLLPVALSGGLLLGQESQAQPAPSPQHQSESQQQISGKIERSDGGKYVLVDSSGTMYQLDDQNAAKKFEGKKVTVSGSVDTNSSTIHVERIRAAK